MQFYIRCASAPHKAWGQRCNKTLKAARPHHGPAAAELYNWPESLSPCRVCAAVMNRPRDISISFPLVAAKSAHSASSLAAKDTKKKSTRSISPLWRGGGRGGGGVSAIAVHVSTGEEGPSVEVVFWTIRVVPPLPEWWFVSAHPCCFCTAPSSSVVDFDHGVLFWLLRLGGYPATDSCLWSSSDEVPDSHHLGVMGKTRADSLESFASELTVCRRIHWEKAHCWKSMHYWSITKS